MVDNINENIIPIIVSNSYERKYYLDKRLESLPKEVKDVLKILFVTHTENVGGCVEVSFDNKVYDLIFRAYKNDDDFDYDEIKANYELNRIEKQNEDLFKKVAEFCKFKLNGLV